MRAGSHPGDAGSICKHLYWYRFDRSSLLGELITGEIKNTGAQNEINLLTVRIFLSKHPFFLPKSA
jgi:hypothetical protein